MASERLRIAQVSPYGWEGHHEVNRSVSRLSQELARRGHQVVVLAPTESADLAARSREPLAALAAGLERAWPADGSPLVLGLGPTLPLGAGVAGAPTRARPRAWPLPQEGSRALQALLDGSPVEFVHVHEPFAPSAASLALRYSRALNVGSFHMAGERVLSTQVARRLVQLLFGPLDARTVATETLRELMGRFFPGDYRLIPSGSDALERTPHEPGRPVEIAFLALEERPALRLFLRALRRLPLEPGWRATVWSQAPVLEPALPSARDLRDRVRFVGPAEISEDELLARADVVVAASSGVAPVPGLVHRALAAGALPVTSRLAEYEEALEAGGGLLFEPRDVQTLAAQLARLVGEPSLRERLAAERDARPRWPEWTQVAEAFEQLYLEVAARRHDPDGRPDVRRRLAGRPVIDVDLHMHTDHSPDCATPVDTLLATAMARGLGAIAVTDHNEISGALEAEARADGIKVIVAEEIKTAGQGEVIGLFIREKIPRGLTLEATIGEIHRQGGLAYVPHPFDRLHSVPDYEHLLGVVERIDAIEVFNPRVAFSAFNEEAERFAAKYRVAAGAGSDSHVAQGLGSVRIRMRDFDGPEEFLESLREADIIRRRQSLLYVQALKFIQTTAKRPPLAAARGPGRERAKSKS